MPAIGSISFFEIITDRITVLISTEDSASFRGNIQLICFSIFIEIFEVYLRADKAGLD
jgi:hypothetical protein